MPRNFTRHYCNVKRLPIPDIHICLAKLNLLTRTGRFIGRQEQKSKWENKAKTTREQSAKKKKSGVKGLKVMQVKMGLIGYLAY